MSNIKWTDEKIAKAAKAFSRRADFQYNSKGAYKAAQRRNILDKVCSHMPTISKQWTNKELYEEALKYNTRSDFHIGSSAYMVAYSRGILDAVCKHMSTKMTPITEEEIYKTAKLYSTIKDFLRSEKRIYHAAMRRGIKDEVCRHMTGAKTVWTDKLILEEAEKYETKMDFKNTNVSAYRAAIRLGILKEVTSHMTISKHFRNRFEIPTSTKGLYFLYNKKEIVYIGKTDSCIKDRVRAHTYNKDFTKVETYEVKSRTDMNIAELYLISLHRPKYNIDSNDDSPLSLHIDNLDTTLINKETYIEKEIEDA